MVAVPVAADVRRVRVVVVSPVRIYLEGLAHLLGAGAGVELIGTAPDVPAVPRLLDRFAVDVILVDLTCAPADESLRRLTGVTDVPVVVLGIPHRPADVVACAAAGVAGYVGNDSTVADLVDALRAASRGEFRWGARVTPALVRRIAALADERGRSPVAELTARELEIVTLIDSGSPNKEIAIKLNIAIPTVKNHVHNILEKLGVDSRGAAAAAVRRQRLP